MQALSVFDQLKAMCSFQAQEANKSAFLPGLSIDTIREILLCFDYQNIHNYSLVCKDLCLIILDEKFLYTWLLRYFPSYSSRIEESKKLNTIYDTYKDLNHLQLNIMNRVFGKYASNNKNENKLFISMNDGKIFSCRIDKASSYIDRYKIDHAIRCRSPISLPKCKTANCMIVSIGIVFMGYPDGFITIANPKEEKYITTQESHPGPVTSMIFSKVLLSEADSFREERLFSGSEDGTIKIWNPETGECLGTLRMDAEITALIVFKEHLFSSSIDGTIMDWNLKTQKQIKILKNEGKVHALAIWKELLVSGGDHLTIWDPETGNMELKKEPFDHEIDSLFTAKELIIISDHNSLHIWDPKKEFVDSLPCRRARNKGSIAFDGEKLCFHEFISGKIVVYDFHSKHTEVFAQIASSLKEDGLQGYYQLSSILDWFSRMPQNGKKRVYKELSSILNVTSEEAEKAFLETHVSTSPTPKQIAEAIERSQEA